MGHLTVLPHRLKAARKRAGIRQQRKLAELAEVSVATIQAYEQNRGHSPNGNTIRSLARALNCTVEYLTGQQEEFGTYVEAPAFIRGQETLECPVCSTKDELIANLEQQILEQRKLHYTEKRNLNLKIQLLEDQLR